LANVIYTGGPGGSMC